MFSCTDSDKILSDKTQGALLRTFPLQAPAVVHALDKLTTAALFCRKLDKANDYSLRLLQAVGKIK